MTTVNIATLKGKLSYYLGLVRQGEEVMITSHGHKVARILPLPAPTSQTRQPSRPVAELLELKGVKPRSISAVETLISDRRRR